MLADVGAIVVGSLQNGRSSYRINLTFKREPTPEEKTDICYFTRLGLNEPGFIETSEVHWGPSPFNASMRLGLGIKEDVEYGVSLLERCLEKINSCLALDEVRIE